MIRSKIVCQLGDLDDHVVEVDLSEPRPGFDEELQELV